MTDDDSGPIGRMKRDMALMRADHETLKDRFEQDHQRLNGIPATLARIDERVNWIADAVKAQATADREQSQQIATVRESDAKRGGGLGVAGGIAMLILGAVVGASVGLVADAIKRPVPRGDYLYESPYQQRPAAMQPGR